MNRMVNVMADLEKQLVSPIVNVNHNSTNTGLDIRIDLAGASKESVDLELGEKGFCVRAESDDVRYEDCYMLGHDVISDEAKAKFESGLLKITVPFKDVVHGHKVIIE